MREAGDQSGASDSPGRAGASEGWRAHATPPPTGVRLQTSAEGGAGAVRPHWGPSRLFSTQSSCY